MVQQNEKSTQIDNHSLESKCIKSRLPGVHTTIRLERDRSSRSDQLQLVYHVETKKYDIVYCK